MHILHVVESFGGGVVTVMVPLLNRQAAQHRVSLLHSERPETPSELGLDAGVSREVVAMPASPGPGVFMSAAQLARRIRVLAPDVIHLHSSMAGVIGRMATMLARFPLSRVVYTPHGFSFLRLDRSALQRKVYYGVESLLALTGAPIVACSEGELALAQGLTPHAFLAQNGVELDVLDAVSAPRTPGPVTVAAVGRVSAARSPETFIEVARQVRAEFPHTRFVWLGWGHGGASEVEWLGPLPREHALRRLSVDVDIVLHPSLWEGLPLAVLEAMALKKPVVARDIIGNRDAVVPEVTGYLAKDVAGMVAGVRALVSDADLRRRMGESGRQRVATWFTSDRQAERLEAIYRKVRYGA